VIAAKLHEDPRFHFQRPDIGGEFCQNFTGCIERFGETVELIVQFEKMTAIGDAGGIHRQEHLQAVDGFGRGAGCWEAGPARAT